LSKQPPIPKESISTLERAKFREHTAGSVSVSTCDVNLDPVTSPYAILDSEGDDCIRVCGESVPQGLANEGRVTMVTVTDASWTRVVATPLVGRRAASTQNTDGFGVDSPASILINYALAVTPAVPPTSSQGIVIRSGEERFYDVNDQVDFWVRVVAGGGSFDVVFEEIA